MGVHLWHGLTALGDGAVLLPCALLLLAWLWAIPATRRTGWWWLAAILVTSGGVALSKVLFMGWGLHPPGLDFTGLSGDAALAFLFWPVAGVLVTDSRRSGKRVFFCVLGSGLALIITVAVVILHYHSQSEAILGGLWGIAIAAGFRVLTWRQPVAAPGIRRWMLASVLLVMVIAFGHRLSSSRVFEWVSARVSGHMSVYVRCDLGSLGQLDRGKQTTCRGMVRPTGLLLQRHKKSLGETDATRYSD